VILPAVGIALRHLKGKTWCRHLDTDPYRTLTAVGSVIHMTGTILGIDSSPKGSLIKVSDGTVIAISTTSRQRITVRAGFQILIPTSGQLAQPSRLGLDSEDRQAAFFLRLDILPMGPTQPAEYLKQRRERRVLLVGQNPSIVKTESSNLKPAKVTVLTPDQVSSDSTLILSRIRQSGAHTVVVVGDFDPLQQILKSIATRLPPRIALLFAYTSG
jgi:hypothetical protein